VSTKDATVNLTANGASNGGFYGALKKTETSGIAGIAATLRVDQVSSNCRIGLKATIGQIENKQIQVSIDFQQYDQLNNITGNKTIQYNIEMFDLITGQSDLVAAGIFGPWDGGWAVGKPLFVGLARVGSELLFYADGFKQMHKIEIQDGIVPLYGNVAGYVYASQGADVSIAGSISDIRLYYP